MIRVPLSPFAMLLLGLLYGGLGGYTLIRAVPAYLDKPDGALMFLMVIGTVFALLGLFHLGWVIVKRRHGLGWWDSP